MSLLVAAILLSVSAIVVNRLEAYFRDQDESALDARALEVASVVAAVAQSAAGGPVIEAGNQLDPDVANEIGQPSFLRLVADSVAKADVTIRIGGLTRTSGGLLIVVPAPGGTFSRQTGAVAEAQESREPIDATSTFGVRGTALADDWGVEVRLANPLTTRAFTVRTITGLLAATAFGALLAAVLVAALMAGRFTRPLRRLTEATRRLGGGDMAGRVPAEELGPSYAEVSELARQFNVMAGRLEESIDIIRRDRDRSRDFLADVSHELRTPIAALRTFNELLREGAWEDEATREEFLESSRGQLERLDWLAQNLLELSKLESGLLALDLRPDDLRVAVESAVEQAEVGARKRGVELELRLPANPLRIRHDPQRIGQVVGNLVGNALKFTSRGGRVVVEVRPLRDGAAIEVRDTGVGIDPAELPHIFERFYRGSSASEARGSGSGLGLAIVKSILDMHGGRISVESRVGAGSSFTVVLPRDPRVGAPDGTPSVPSDGEPASPPGA